MDSDASTGTKAGEPDGAAIGTPRLLGLPRGTAIWLAALLVGAAVAYTAVWGTTPRVAFDTHSYQYVAQQLVRGHLIELPYRSLGYPAILALTGSSEDPTPTLYFLQLAFYLTTVWIIVVLGQRFRMSRATSLALVVVLLSPPLVQNVRYAMTETTCQLLITLTVFFLVRFSERHGMWDAGWAGLAIGAASLVRPTYQLYGFLVAAVAFALLRRTGDLPAARRAAGVLLIGPVLLIGGVTLLNWTLYDYPGPSPMLGWNLSTKTALFFEAIPESDPARDILIEARDLGVVANPVDGAQMAALGVMGDVQTAEGMDRAEVARHMVAVNLALIFQRPVGYASSVLTAGGTYVLPSMARVGGEGPVGTVASQAVIMAHFALLAVFLAQLFGVVGLDIARRLGTSVRGPFGSASARRTWWIALSLIAYTALVTVSLDVGRPRQRAPTDPLIVMLAFGGFAMLYAAFARGAVPDQPTS